MKTRTEKLTNGLRRAKLGPFSEQGRTVVEAEQKLRAAIEQEPSMFVPRVMIGPDGGKWCFFRAPGSWCYVQPSGCLCTIGGELGAALNSFEAHFAQTYGQAS